LLGKLDILGYVFVLQQFLGPVEVLSPPAHQSCHLALKSVELVISGVVSSGNCAAIPRLFIELLPALEKLVSGLPEGAVERLLILISTFNILVSSDVSLKLSRYFVSSSSSKYSLLNVSAN
jgi:hypothetical protein